MEALQAAALLHDIGKLAVPEHIISKPGRLTPEEFEKMKIHPVVGAEILERVRFPYPVVPIVRAHHEKWDGSRLSLRAEGRRDSDRRAHSAAVDFLDALASDRQYRRALPLDEVMKRLQAESGKSFDPRSGETFCERRYRELEKLVDDRSRRRTVVEALDRRESRARRGAGGRLRRHRASRTHRPGSHVPVVDRRGAAGSADPVRTQPGPGRLAQPGRNAVGVLGEAEAAGALRLPSRSTCGATTNLVPEYVSGDNFRLFSSLRIPLGQGLSGWVAQNRKPIINGNPSVEPGYLNDPTKFSTLRSALAVPLEGLSGVVGVLTLYHAEADAFTSDHLRILLAISSKMALAIENALKYQQAESSATTDYLTGCPTPARCSCNWTANWRAASATTTSLAVMVCDMDGFKQINDRFGHLEGNRVLRLFAQALKDSLPRIRLRGAHGRRRICRDRAGPDRGRRRQESGAACANWRARRARKSASEDILSLSVGQACIRKTETTRKNCWPKPTAACTSKSRSSLRARTAACIRA